MYSIDDKLFVKVQDTKREYESVKKRYDDRKFKKSFLNEKSFRYGFL